MTRLTKERKEDISALLEEIDALKDVNDRCHTSICELAKERDQLVSTVAQKDFDLKLAQARIDRLKFVLSSWLSSTRTNKDGKYCEMSQWHACRAFEALTEDNKCQE